MKTLEISTQAEHEFVDITQRVKEAVSNNEIENGLLMLFVPHTTAGILINEHADPSVARDIQADLERLAPWRQSYYQHGEGNSSSHTRASLIGSSELVIIEAGEVQLGTWQGIFFCEFDGPRRRRVWLKFMSS